MSNTAFASSTSVRFGNHCHLYKRKRTCTARRLLKKNGGTIRMGGGAETVGHIKEVERYLKTIAKTEKPAYLDALIHILTMNNESTLMSPTSRTNLHPFFIPLGHDEKEETMIGLLRWPTPPDNFPLPVVKCRTNDPCLTLLSSSVKAHVTREIVEADFSGNEEIRDEIRNASSLALAYQNGDVDSSGLGVERYLISSMAGNGSSDSNANGGGFPDIYEGLTRFHLAKGDESSALITCERAARAQVGWARPHAYHAHILQQLGRELEARDAARFCLTLPLWTLGSLDTLKEMGTLAGYQDEESLGKIYRRLFEDGRAEEIADGKPAAQVALDRAAWLLDVCVAEGINKETSGWDDVRERLAELYDEAGLNDMATFVRY